MTDNEIIEEAIRLVREGVSVTLPVMLVMWCWHGWTAVGMWCTASYASTATA